MKTTRILIVDDHREHAEGLAEGIEKLNLESTVAGSGEEGINALKADRFDIVITDLMMKDVDGMDLLREARRRSDFTEVIMVTGYKEEMASAIKKALSISAYTCFYKPLEIDELLRTIETPRNRELARILGRRSGKKG